MKLQSLLWSSDFSVFLQYHSIPLPGMEQHPVCTSLMIASRSLVKSLFRHKHTEVVEIRRVHSGINFSFHLTYSHVWLILKGVICTESAVQDGECAQAISVWFLLSFIHLLCRQSQTRLRETSAKGAWSMDQVSLREVLWIGNYKKNLWDPMCVGGTGEIKIASKPCQALQPVLRAGAGQGGTAVPCSAVWILLLAKWNHKGECLLLMDRYVATHSEDACS